MLTTVTNKAQYMYDYIAVHRDTLNVTLIPAMQKQFSITAKQAEEAIFKYATGNREWFDQQFPENN